MRSARCTTRGILSLCYPLFSGVLFSYVRHGNDTLVKRRLPSRTGATALRFTFRLISLWPTTVAPNAFALWAPGQAASSSGSAARSMPWRARARSTTPMRHFTCRGPSWPTQRATTGDAASRTATPGAASFTPQRHGRLLSASKQPSATNSTGASRLRLLDGAGASLFLLLRLSKRKRLARNGRLSASLLSFVPPCLDDAGDVRLYLRGMRDLESADGKHVAGRNRTAQQPSARSRRHS